MNQNSKHVSWADIDQLIRWKEFYFILNISNNEYEFKIKTNLYYLIGP